MSELFDAAELDRIAGVLAADTHEGYPALERRLHLADVAIGSTLWVPDGPWHVENHPNRRGVPSELLDPEVPNQSEGRLMVTSKLSARWMADGLMLDQYGRPVHPYWKQLLEDPRIGLPTGVGYFYKYGPTKPLIRWCTAEMASMGR